MIAATGVALLAAGSIFGSRPLQQIGLALMVLLLLAIAVVRLGKHDLSVERAINPQRARSEQDVTVSLALRNKGAGAAPLLLIEDLLPPRLAGRSRFTLNGIEADGRRDVSYTVRPHRRGHYEVGPLTLKMIDPFGLARLSSEAASAQSFLVHPPTEKLALPRDAGDRRSVSTSALRQPTGTQGEDFYALREYVQGDDLRKVHWPSTARRGKVMIRQEETPWHTKATILLDDRSHVHTTGGESPSFERAVEVAASVVQLYHNAGYGFRLAGAHHPGFPSARGVPHLHRCLDLLATIRTQRSEGENALLSRLVEMEARGAAEETLVLVTGSLDSSSAAAVARLRSVFKQIIVVSLPAHRFSSQPTKQRWEGEQTAAEVTGRLARSGIRSVMLGPGEPLAPAWSAAAAGKQRGGETPWGQKPELV